MSDLDLRVEMSRVKLAKAERWRSLQDLLAAMREHADSVWAEHPSSSSSRTPRAPSGFLKRIRSRKNLQENSSTSRPLDSFYQFIQSIHEKFGDKEKYERYYEWEERNNVVPAQRLETKLNEIDCLLEGLAKPETGQDVRETMSRDIWKKISQFRSDLDENIKQSEEWYQLNEYPGAPTRPSSYAPGTAYALSKRKEMIYGYRFS